MADDLQITPQGNEPANGDSSESSGGYKFDPSGGGAVENGKIDLSENVNPSSIPGLIGASTEQEEERIVPIKLESDVPSVEETSTREGSADDVSLEESSMEMATEEVPSEIETPTEPAPIKKGLSKAVLIGGALALAMLIGAGAYYGLGGLFKGELAVPTNLEVVQYPSSEEIISVCPVNEYYDAEITSSPTMLLQDDQFPDLTTTSTALERNFAARDFGRAQTMQMSDTILPQDDSIPDTTIFDPSRCRPIPQTDCDLLENLLADPSKYYISEITIVNMEEWIEACRATPVQIVCGTNQSLQRDETCACNVDYFDISASTQTDIVTMSDFIDTSSTLQCVNCEEINEIIRRKSAELDSLPLATDTSGIEAEITSLKEIASENCPAEEIIPERDVINVVEKSECEQFAENSEILLARGDVRGSYDAIIEYIRNDCIRTYTDCEESLAIAKTAKEYSVLATNLSPASVSYFDDQYIRNRNAFYANPLCVNTSDLCVEVQSERENSDSLMVDTATEPSVELLRTDRGSTDVLTITPEEDEPLTTEKLQRDVEYYISVKGIEDDREKSDYINRYCEEDVFTPREEPAPVRDVAPVMIEEPAPVRDVAPVMIEEPAPVKLVPIEFPGEGVIAPPPIGIKRY